MMFYSTGVLVINLLFYASICIANDDPLVEKIYNEFNNGHIDKSAIKKMDAQTLKFLGDMSDKIHSLEVKAGFSFKIIN